MVKTNITKRNYKGPLEREADRQREEERQTDEKKKTEIYQKELKITQKELKRIKAKRTFTNIISGVLIGTLTYLYITK